MWKVSDLITTASQIPWFCNQLHTRQHWVLKNDVKKSTQLIDIMKLPSQRAAEIKTESVDMHFLAVHDQLQNSRTLHVQSVTAPGKVLIVARIAGHQSIV